MVHEQCNKTKTKFKDDLDSRIKYSMKDIHSGLTYDDPADKKKIRKLLFLFNVESVHSFEENTQWFPFDKFKVIDNAPGGFAEIKLTEVKAGNLDEESTQNIINSLEYLAHEQGICVIIVTHDMEVAERADKVLRLVNGKLE